MSGYDFTGTTTGTDVVLYRFTPITSGTPGGLDPNFNYLGTFEGGAPGNTGYTLYSATDGGTSDTVAPDGDRGTALAMGADGGLYIAATTREGSTNQFSLTKLTNDQYQNVGSISGTVYADANSDGTKDAGESGLADQDVFLDYNADGLFDAGDVEVLTDSSGGYSFIGLPHAQYRVVQPPPTGDTDTQPAGVDYYASVNVLVALDSGGNDFGVAGTTATPDADADATPPRRPPPRPRPRRPPPAPARSSGPASWTTTATAAQQATEPGLYSWGVFLDLNGNGQLDATDTRVFTNSLGQFAFTDLAPGTYSIRQNTPTGYTLTTAAFPVTVTVTADAVSRVTIGNEYRGTPGTTTVGQITGTVFDDANRNATVDYGEHGLAGFGVYLDANNDGTYDAGDTRVFTDANGLYQFLGIAPGIYRVRESAAGRVHPDDRGPPDHDGRGRQRGREGEHRLPPDRHRVRLRHRLQRPERQRRAEHRRHRPGGRPPGPDVDLHVWRERDRDGHDQRQRAVHDLRSDAGNVRAGRAAPERIHRDHRRDPAHGHPGGQRFRGREHRQRRLNRPRRQFRPLPAIAGLS